MCVPLVNSLAVTESRHTTAYRGCNSILGARCGFNTHCVLAPLGLGFGLPVFCGEADIRSFMQRLAAAKPYRVVPSFANMSLVGRKAIPASCPGKKKCCQRPRCQSIPITQLYRHVGTISQEVSTSPAQLFSCEENGRPTSYQVKGSLLHEPLSGFTRA